MKAILEWAAVTATASITQNKEVKVPLSAILFAMLSGVSAATWTICLKLGATKINAALGAMVIAAVALLVNSVVLFTLRAHGHEIILKQEAFWLLVVAGIAAAGVDIFALLAYERGLRVTSSLIMRGTSTALVLLVGVSCATRTSDGGASLGDRAHRSWDIPAASARRIGMPNR